MERDLSQEAAERLLSGDLTSPPDGTERLAALLAAASAPGRPDELAGEAAAMAAFRAQPQTVRRWSLRRALTVKVAAIVTAVTVAVGGVAVASGTGLLPVPFIPGKVGPVPSGADGPAGHQPGQGRTTNPANNPPNEDVPKLCSDWQKKTAEEKPKALKGRQFERLVQDAGGEEKVEAFCARVLGATPTPSKGRDDDGQGNGVPETSGTGSQGEDDQGRPTGPPALPPTGPPSTTHTRVNPTG